MSEFGEIVAPLEAEMFLEWVKIGTPPLHAAIEVGWSPAKLKKMLADPDFKALVDSMEEYKDQTIEQALFDQAKKGAGWAVQMWLYNRQPDRWRETKRIEVKSETTVQIGIVASVKEAALALLRERPMAELQEGILDAEIIKEDEDA